MINQYSLVTVDGTAMAEAKCTGGVNIAAHWENVAPYTACRPGPQSGVTDDLKDLSEVRANYSATLLKRLN